MSEKKPITWDTKLKDMGPIGYVIAAIILGHSW
jgi:hypothetical protein